MRELSFEQTRENPEAIKNFNDQVWVKVTPDGERVREEYYESFNIRAPELKRDEEGWTRMQLYEVAHFFGSEMYHGNDCLPIEMTFK